jgi:hypothetical protein
MSVSRHAADPEVVENILCTVGGRLSYLTRVRQCSTFTLNCASVPQNATYRFPSHMT